MSQSLNFSALVKMLFYNIDISNLSADSIINQFHPIAEKHVVGKKSYSLFNSHAIKKDLFTSKTTHQFKFKNSPVEQLTIDAGYINFDIASANGLNKVINVEWVMHFQDKQKADVFFEFLEIKFSTVSDIKKAGTLEFNPGKYIEFSNRTMLNKAAINDIALFFSKSSANAMYEIKLLLYNDFSE